MADNEGSRRPATSHDVARLAGVSRAAVSRTFTPNASVSPETREKVNKAARELGYRVNYLARSLINQRSDLVGVVAANLDNPFRVMQIDQLTRRLLARNLRPILLPTSRSEDVATFIEQLLQYSVSGVIITSDAPPTALCEECSRNAIPIVMINKGEAIPLVDRVINDDQAAGQGAAELLIGEGCRNLAVMAAPDVSFTARQRLHSFMKTAARTGVQVRLIESGLNDYESGRQVAKGLVESPIDGLFCVNDYMACGVIDGLKETAQASSRTPMRVVGHDDIPQAAWGAYQLTSFAQPCDLQADAAIELLEQRINEPEAPAQLVTTPVHLVRRKSA